MIAKRGYRMEIVTLPESGYLIFPLSMGRLDKGQNPKTCLKGLEFFVRKMNEANHDIIFIYSNGLYFNSDGAAYKTRQEHHRLINQHKAELQQLIKQSKIYPAKAIHFISWDQLILNTERFFEAFEHVRKEFTTSLEFQMAVVQDLKEKQRTPANVDFILEELTLFYLLKHQKTSLPKTLCDDHYRLMIYPGEYMQSELFLTKNNILEQFVNDKPVTNCFNRARYDLSKRCLNSYDHPHSLNRKVKVGDRRIIDRNH